MAAAPRDHRAQLHDRVVALPLHPAGADDEAVLVEGEVRGVEEVDLPNLGVEGIHPQRRPRSASVGHRHRQLELDAVGALGQREDSASCLSESAGVAGTETIVVPFSVVGESDYRERVERVTWPYDATVSATWQPLLF